MFPFSQEMSSDEAALIPLASGRGRGLSGEGSIPWEAWQRVLFQKGSPWGGGHPNLHFSQFLPESWIRFVPCHPLGRPPLSRIPALRPWSPDHAATGGDWERGPRLLRGLCRPKGK